MRINSRQIQLFYILQRFYMQIEDDMIKWRNTSDSDSRFMEVKND